jgi:uncharacterized membrane protein
MAYNTVNNMIKTTLSYKTFTRPILLLSLLGLSASFYLALSHYRNYTDIGYSSFCAISQAINCDTVSQSSWSILFGLPLAIWGVLAYGLFFIIALPAQKNSKERRYLWDFLFVLALLYSLADIYFGYISASKIHAYCIVCLLTYGVSLTLLFLIWMIRGRFNEHSLGSGIKKSFSFLLHHKKTALALVLLLLTTGITKIFLPAYWIYSYPEFSKNVHSGTTEHGRPWIGAEQPALPIKEFTDYQCFQCGKVHLTLRSLVNAYPDTIRLIHYHYPMDENFNTVLVKQPFHTGSGGLALLAIAAGKQGQFWEVNDALYSIARQELKEFNISKFAGKMNLDADKLKQDMYSLPVIKKLEDDIRTGLKHNIIGTPSFIINDRVYAGHLPPEVLNKIVR